MKLLESGEISIVICTLIMGYTAIMEHQIVIQLLILNLQMLNFLDCIYTLKRSKAPGFDNISNDDIMSHKSDDSSETKMDPRKKFHPCALFSESCPISGLTNVSHKISREQFWDPSSKIRKNPCAILQIIDQSHSQTPWWKYNKPLSAKDSYLILKEINFSLLSKDHIGAEDLLMITF